MRMLNTPPLDPQLIGSLLTDLLQIENFIKLQIKGLDVGCGRAGQIGRELPPLGITLRVVLILPSREYRLHWSFAF